MLDIDKAIAYFTVPRLKQFFKSNKLNKIKTADLTKPLRFYEPKGFRFKLKIYLRTTIQTNRHLHHLQIHRPLSFRRFRHR